MAIGRAIVRKPKVFLFDEPLSNLDAALRVNMRIELSRLHKELGTTMIYVTHDQVEAMTMGDRIAVFNNGVVEQLGAPMDLYKQPANEFVASFIGAPQDQPDRPSRRPTAAAHRALWDALAAQRQPARSASVCGPSTCTWCAGGQGIPAQVELAEHLGDTSIVHLRVDGVVRAAERQGGRWHDRLETGQTVGLVSDAAWALAFGADGRLLK